MTHIWSYASVKWVFVGSDYGLSPFWCQVITWNNAVVLSIWPLGTNISDIRIKNTQLFIHENVVCEMNVILYRVFARWCRVGDELIYSTSRVMCLQFALCRNSMRFREVRVYIHVLKPNVKIVCDVDRKYTLLAADEEYCAFYANWKSRHW